MRDELCLFCDPEQGFNCARCPESAFFVRVAGRRQSLRPYNGLANSRFHTLLFGINRLRSDELPHCWANSRCSEAFVQLLCNQNSNGLSCRCRPITSANDGASRGFAIFRSAAPKWPIQSIQARSIKGDVKRNTSPPTRW